MDYSREKSALSGKIDPPTKCTATWTTLNFEGKNQKAIKVTSITQGENWKVEVYNIMSIKPV